MKLLNSLESQRLEHVVSEDKILFFKVMLNFVGTMQEAKDNVGVGC